MTTFRLIGFAYDRTRTFSLDLELPASALTSAAMVLGCRVVTTPALEREIMFDENILTTENVLLSGRPSPHVLDFASSDVENDSDALSKINDAWRLFLVRPAEA